MSGTPSPWLTAKRLSHTLPDGRVLFSDLNLALYPEPTALVGRNGSGKSLLGALLCARLPLQGGEIESSGRIAYLPQRVAPQSGRLVDRLGCGAQWDALERIANGSCAEADFDAVVGVWDLPARLRHWLARFGLAGHSPDDPLTTLSGGELARIDLISVLWQEPDHLLLDEPSNHLDGSGRELLTEFISQWRGGLLLISHDRELLEQVSVVHHLDGLGLQRYGGNYSFYAQSRAEQQQGLAQQLTQGKAALRRERSEESELQQRQQKRLAHGQQQRRKGSQSKLILNRQREQSQKGSRRLAENQSARVDRQRQVVESLAQRLEIVTPPRLQLRSSEASVGRLAVSVEALSFGFETPLFDAFNLHLIAAERCALVGDNGSGKSTLLRLLTGALKPQRGSVRLHQAWACVDQQTSLLSNPHTPLENFQRLAPGLGESEYRQQLDRLGLSRAHIATPVAQLSGGERLKTALAATLLGPQTQPLLILDEPTNHLDLDMLGVLEQALRDYHGTLLVVSHDERFLREIGVERRVEIDP